MPRNVFIVLFTCIIISNDKIQLQISSIKHYGTDVFTFNKPLCGKTVTKTRLELNAKFMAIIIIIIMITTN
jgi:hypothetical protein